MGYVGESGGDTERYPHGSEVAAVAQRLGSGAIGVVQKIMTVRPSAASLAPRT